LAQGLAQASLCHLHAWGPGAAATASHTGEYAARATMANTLLEMFGKNSRACSFHFHGGDNPSANVDLSFVCHEARNIEIAEGESVYVSVRDVGRGKSEQSGPLGSTLSLRTASPDTTLLLSVWAVTDEAAMRQRRSAGEGSGRRPCGELRIPLSRLLHHCHSMLYQTWAVLDYSGLTDSVASVGLGDDPNAFDQGLIVGARQLNQPRVCLSVCRAGDIPANGRLLLAADTPPEVRAERWGALLRSQQQHAALSAALYNGGREEAPQRTQDQRSRQERARERCDTQAAEIEDLRRRLAEGQRQCRTPPSGSPRERQNAESKEAEAARLRRENETTRAELEARRLELDKIREEANSKIDGANDRIRSLRQDRDEARDRIRQGARDVEVGAQEVSQLRSDNAALAGNIKELNDILHDLQQTAAAAGLNMTIGRRTIDSLNGVFGLS